MATAQKHLELSVVAAPPSPSNHFSSIKQVTSDLSSTNNKQELIDQYNSLNDNEEQEELPTPYVKIYLIGMMLLVNNYSIFVIPTILPFMIQDFFPEQSLKDLGLQIGLLSSAFNFGQFLSGYIWGATADRIGRRPVLIFGLFGTLVGIITFGFAPNYYIALTARFLWGILNGNVPVAKTYLSEVCDEKSQAKGFAVIGSAQSVGRIIGPVVAGFLANPADKYPCYFAADSVFARFKYLLPLLVGILFCVITIPFCFNHLSESLKDEKKVQFKDGVKKKKDSGSMLLFMWENPTVVKASSLFVLISFISTFLEELFSLWLATQVAIGGFGFNTSQIGLVNSLASPVPLVFQTFLFAPAVLYMGYKLVFMRSMLLSGVTAFIIPYCSTLYRNTGSFYGSYAFLIAIFAAFLVGRFYAFAAVYGLINNSCEAQRGAVNGFSQSIAAGSRILAAAVGTTILSSTADITNGVTDYHLVFHITFALCLITAYIDYTLPDSINNKPKKAGKAAEALVVNKIDLNGDSRTGGLLPQSGVSSVNNPPSMQPDSRDSLEQSLLQTEENYKNILGNQKNMPFNMIKDDDDDSDDEQHKASGNAAYVNSDALISTKRTNEENISRGNQRFVQKESKQSDEEISVRNLGGHVSTSMPVIGANGSPNTKSTKEPSVNVSEDKEEDRDAELFMDGFSVSDRDSQLSSIKQSKPTMVRSEAKIRTRSIMDRLNPYYKKPKQRKEVNKESQDFMRQSQLDAL